MLSDNRIKTLMPSHRKPHQQFRTLNFRICFFHVQEAGCLGVHNGVWKIHWKSVHIIAHGQVEMLAVWQLLEIEI